MGAALSPHLRALCAPVAARIATDPGQEQAVGGAPRVPATRPRVCGLEGSSTEHVCRSARVGALSGTYRVRGHQRNGGVTGSAILDGRGPRMNAGQCSGEEYPLRQDRKDGPAGPTWQQPRLPAKGQLPALGPWCWDATGTHALRTGTRCQTRCRWGWRTPGPADPPPHILLLVAPGPQLHRVHALRIPYAPAPRQLRGLQCGAQRPSVKARAPTATMCHRVSTWTPSRLVWGELLAEGKGCVPPGSAPRLATPHGCL